jgi:hypothetical protein
MFSQKFGGGLGRNTGGGDKANIGGWGDISGFSDTWSGLSGFSDELTMGDIDWQSIINQGFAVGSQAINAFGGAHTGTQVGVNSSGGIFAIQQTTHPTFDEATLYSQGVNPVGGTPVVVPQQGVAEDALGSISALVSQHPIMVFGGIAALFLLYREPPRRR